MGHCLRERNHALPRFPHHLSVHTFDLPPTRPSHRPDLPPTTSSSWHSASAREFWSLEVSSSSDSSRQWHCDRAAVSHSSFTIIFVPWPQAETPAPGLLLPVSVCPAVRCLLYNRSSIVVYTKLLSLCCERATFKFPHSVQEH